MHVEFREHLLDVVTRRIDRYTKLPGDLGIGLPERNHQRHFALLGRQLQTCCSFGKPHGFRCQARENQRSCPLPRHALEQVMAKRESSPRRVHGVQRVPGGRSRLDHAVQKLPQRFWFGGRLHR